MEGEKKQPCHVCDGEDYYVEAGFYYCKECHTQAQGYCENFLDLHENTLNVLNYALKDKSVQKLPRKKKEQVTSSDCAFHWTSWEAHNFVLKGLVDELIALGARPELKTVALQLWTKYLSKLEVAFISKTEELLPKFGFYQTPMDYKIIYGQVKEKTKRLKKRLTKNESSKSRLEAKLSQNDITEKQTYLLAKKLCVMAEYEQIMAELTTAQDVLNQIDERLKLLADTKEAAQKKSCVVAKERVEPAPKLDVQYNNKAKKWMKKIEERLKKIKNVKGDGEEVDVEKELDESTIYDIERKEKQILSLTNCYDSMRLTRQKILALLALALFISKDDIQISDLLRWIQEGHMSYSHVTHLFPEDVILTYNERVFLLNPPLMSYKSLEMCLLNLTDLLGLKDSLPTPDLAGLARRYARELELPTGLADRAEALMSASRIQEYKGLLSHEAIAMAFLIVVLKTLLGLDGLTEHSISAVATKINSLIDQDHERQLQTKLFVWDDWVRYIVCRKAIVMNAHFQTRFRCEDDLSISSNTYVDWWYKQKDKDPNLLKKRQGTTPRYSEINVQTANELQLLINSLPNIGSEDHLYKLPPTLTPLTSYLQEIRAQWCLNESSCSVQLTEVLTYMHSLTDVDFLVQPNRIIEFARSKGIVIEVQHSRMHQETDKVSRQVKGLLRMPYQGRVENSIALLPYYKPPSKRRHLVNSEELLREYLSIDHTAADEIDECYLQPSKKRKLIDVTVKQEGNSNNTNSENKLILYAPFHDYWVYELNAKQPDSYFETNIESDLPNSFRWLLIECSRLLEMRTIDLYAQVRLIEDLCFDKKHLASLKLSVSNGKMMQIPK